MPENIEQQLSKLTELVARKAITEERLRIIKDLEAKRAEFDQNTVVWKALTLAGLIVMGEAE